MSAHEGVRGKPILVIAVEDEDRDYHAVFDAVHKTLCEQGRQITGAHEFWGVYMLTVTTATEKKP